MNKITFKNFKKQVEKNIGMKIDFRTHQFLENSNGGMPAVDYDTMKKIVEGVCDLALEIGDLDLNVDFNLKQLEIGVLKIFMQDVCFRINQGGE